MDRIIEKLCDAMIGDGSNRTWKLRRIEQELHLLHASHVERAAEFAIRFTPPGGAELTTTIHAMTGDEIDRTRRPAGIATHPWAATLDQESRTMWSTWRSMDGQDLDRSGQRPDRFLEAMLEEMEENDVRTLVMDLRGATGDDLDLAHRVFASIAREPFRSIAVPSMRGNDAHDPRIEPVPAPSPVGGGLSNTRHRERSGRSGTLHQPDPRAFRGRIHVICDGATRNAAAALVMAARRTGTARIFGEETGTNSASYTGGGHTDLLLPVSGVRVRIPVHRFIPEGTSNGPVDHGEFPDHAVATSPHALSKGLDGVKRSMTRLINELR